VPLPSVSQTQQPVNDTVPPSLAEISAGKVQRDSNGIRDFAYTTKTEDAEMMKKRDYLFKFKILKKQYKDTQIPDFSEYTPLDTLQREYDNIVRQLALESTVENYKRYLQIGFFIVEFVLLNIFKFTDIQGFATQQLLGMNQYEQLLYQIGEKSYMSKSKWPPEVKLLGLVIVNTVIFIGGKMLLRATGANIANILNPQKETSKPTSASASSSDQGPKKTGKMRGPTIDIEELTGKKTL
jgi:hypothetical protein